MIKNNKPPDDDEQTHVEDLIRDASLEITAQVIRALDDLPILARLQFARNLIHANGGDKHSLPQHSELVIVLGVIDDVIDVLEKRPPAAKLRTTAPRLG
jgi:hypothetical protein